MGLYAYELRRIVKLTKQLKPPFSALSFGHPDILATPEELLPIVGTILPKIGEGKLDRQNYDPNVVGDAHLVFEALGGLLHVIDFRKSFGVNQQADLNHKLYHAELFDLVIDPGTSEHCFNVGTALVNMASCVRLGGYIYHMVPMAHWNHGFWNFSPCVFADFYRQNGFQVLELLANRRGVFLPVQERKGGEKFEIPNSGRKLDLMCIARRMNAQTIEFPVQYKYAP